MLLPICVAATLFLVWRGIPQTLGATVGAAALDGGRQLIARCPAASQIAIKLLSGDGGGFFNANSAHPFENPTAEANLVEMLLRLCDRRPDQMTMLAILCIPIVIVPRSAGTLPTNRILFVLLLLGVIVVVGGLTFLPALSLGPAAEQLAMRTGHLYRPVRGPAGRGNGLVWAHPIRMDSLCGCLRYTWPPGVIAAANQQRCCHRQALRAGVF